MTHTHGLHKFFRQKENLPAIFRQQPCPKLRWFSVRGDDASAVTSSVKFSPRHMNELVYKSFLSVAAGAGTAL